MRGIPGAKKNASVRLPDGGPDQGHDAKFDAVATPDGDDDWPYHAVANTIRAHSLLRSFPDVDPGRTAITGISWGGYTTCLVASLDDHFRAAVPVYGCGHLRENSCSLGDFERIGAEAAARWTDRGGGIRFRARGGPDRQARLADRSCRARR
jgi:cephalosporin-C deacetylase-like acetyl esterase